MGGEPPNFLKNSMRSFSQRNSMGKFTNKEKRGRVKHEPVGQKRSSLLIFPSCKTCYINMYVPLLSPNNRIISSLGHPLHPHHGLLPQKLRNGHLRHRHRFGRLTIRRTCHHRRWLRHPHILPTIRTRLKDQKSQTRRGSRSIVSFNNFITVNVS